ncbi:GMC oxidoreductase [Nesterenkonia haasae]|uniref:GMC oxidoreductase n=1 Tax=Nesterenkonia haasae TaxID=2587813 RepID=UPI001391E0AD|nr:GMC oxidoreductase [Nesterenkonia haasae]NDK32778.1 GMC family oxidoreductase [Nesterenkonia haasae]
MEIPTQADVIVIGSGFGGAVAAARLAQAGFSVIVLERGRRWALGEFPRRPVLEDGWLWDVDRGLYDIRWLGTMAAVQGAGWGGGSLVYANVFSRPFEGAMDQRWPAHLRREELDRYYDLAAHMMGLSPAGDDPATGSSPARTTAIENMVRNMAIPDSTVRPNLAVTFGDPETWRENMHGVPRRGCAYVGECIIGCNHGAKNTLDATYLAVAEAHGAFSLTDAEATRIEPDSDEDDPTYTVTVTTPSDPRAPVRRFTASQVVLAAGAVATNELLLRSRDRHATLPGLSPQLGRGFSGNGDFVTLTQLRGEGANMSTGPTITTSTVLSVPEGRSTVWYQVQDGAIPPPLQALYDTLAPARNARQRWQRLRKTHPNRTFALLAMGQDSARGTLRLDAKGQAVLTWANRWQRHLYRSQRRVGPLVAKLLGARQYNPITWSLLRRTTTVHPLGGVRPGPEAASGVVDSAGEVYGYPGLWVMDGSVLPAATGVNPSATILASTERSVEAMIRRSGHSNWRAPEWEDVRPMEAPEDAAFQAAAEQQRATEGNGVTFCERMGTYSTSYRSADRGDRPRQLSMTLAAEVSSLTAFFANPVHPVTIQGTIDVEGVARRASIAGILSLFPEGSAEAMRYDLKFDDDRGVPWHLTGVKRVESRRPDALLRGLTTLQTRISPVNKGSSEAPDPSAPSLGTNRPDYSEHDEEAEQLVLRISTMDLARLGASLRGLGFTQLRRIRAVGRFADFFARSALRTPAPSRIRPQTSENPRSLA